MSYVADLTRKGFIKPPKFVVSNTLYETIMGSVAYGVSNDTSDMDVYGFCIPPKEDVFPHLRGEIMGFGRQIQRFEQYQEHHIKDPSSQKEYDLTIYSIVKYFQLVMENNPNMIDSIFTPRRCVLHSTKVAEMVRDARKSFLHKGAWHKFKGYAYAQMSKIKNKTNSSNERRAEWIEKYGYDVKFAYHVVRLLDEVEQILVEGDLDLERNREQLKSIRRGEWKLEDIEAHFQAKEKELESVYLSSKLPHSPDEDAIKALLMNCLEEHYGSLSNAIVMPGMGAKMIADLERLVETYKGKV